MSKKLLLTLLAILIVAGLFQPVAASEDDAQIIFAAAETLYPQWFYPADLPIQRYDGYDHLMYYRHYPDKNIYLLTYDGVVYYFYAGRYIRWFTANDWLAYLGSQQSLPPGEWLSVFCIAYLGRAPDPGSYQEWESSINSGELTLAQVVANISHSQEARNNAPYLDDPESATRDQIISFVRSVYIYLQSRLVPANDKDVVSWVEELEHGRITPEEVIRQIVHVAIGRASSDWLAISHKIQAGEYFMERFRDLQRNWRTADRTLARRALEQITADPDSLVAARTHIDQLLDESNVRKWEYEPTLDATTGEAGPDQKVTLGDPGVNRVQVELPAGAFAEETPVTLSHPTQPLVFDQARFAPLGVPLTLKVSGASQRLNEPAQVNIRFDPQTVQEPGEVFIAYHHDVYGMYFQSPDQVDLSQGLLSFTTHHFSSYSAGKLEEQARIEDLVHRKSLEQDARSNATPEEQIEEVVRALMADGLKIPDKTIVSIITRAVIEEAPFGKIGLALYDLNGVEFANATLAEILKQLVKQRTSLEEFGVSSSAIAALATAAGHFVEGDSEGALKALSAEIADNLPVIQHIKKVGKVAAEVTDHIIHNLWLEPELQKAYQVFKNGATSRSLFGYQVEPGNFEDVWSQMRGVAHKVTSDAIARYCYVRDIRPCNLSQQVQNHIREDAKNKLEKQFRERRTREAEIEKIRADNQKLVDLLQEMGLLRREYGNALYTGSENLEDLLSQLFGMLDKIRYDTGRTQLVDDHDWDVAQHRGMAQHLLPREFVADLIFNWFYDDEAERENNYLKRLTARGLLAERFRVQIAKGDITYVPDSGRTAARINLTATASPAGTYTYHWNFGDGQIVDHKPSAGKPSGGTKTYSNLQEGRSFLVTVILYSRGGRFLATNSMSVTFQEDDADMLSIDPSFVSGLPNQYFFTLTAENLPASVTSVNFTWDFGTGIEGSLYSSRQGQKTVGVNYGRAVYKIGQVYAESGSYQVTASAFDGDSGSRLGTATASVSIGEPDPFSPCFFEPDYSELVFWEGYDQHYRWHGDWVIPWIAYWSIPDDTGAPGLFHGPHMTYTNQEKTAPLGVTCHRDGIPEGLSTRWWNRLSPDPEYYHIEQVPVQGVERVDSLLFSRKNGMSRIFTPDGKLIQISNYVLGKREGYYWGRAPGPIEPGHLHTHIWEGYYRNDEAYGIWKIQFLDSDHIVGAERGDYCLLEESDWLRKVCCSYCYAKVRDDEGEYHCNPPLCDD